MTKAGALRPIIVPVGTREVSQHVLRTNLATAQITVAVSSIDGAKIDHLDLERAVSAACERYGNRWDRYHFTWPLYGRLDPELDDEETVHHIRACYGGA